MISLIGNIIGAAGAITFVGYFAYKVDKPALIVIVVVCLCLMLYGLYDDMRDERTMNRAREDRDANRPA